MHSVELLIVWRIIVILNHHKSFIIQKITGGLSFTTELQILQFLQLNLHRCCGGGGGHFNEKREYVCGLTKTPSTTIGLRSNLSTINCANTLSTENIQSAWSEKISVVSDLALCAQTIPWGWNCALRSSPQWEGHKLQLKSTLNLLSPDWNLHPYAQEREQCYLPP